MPFSGSRAISECFEILKQRFGPMLALWGVFFVVQMVLFVAVFAVMGLGGMGAMAGGMAGPELPAGFLLGMILFVVAMLYISGASSAALIAAASPLSRSSFADALRIGFLSGFTLMGFFALLIVAYIALVLVFVAIFAGIGMVVGQTAAIVVAVILGLTLGLAGLAYVGTKISLVTAVVAVDGVRNPIAALAKSWRMTKGATLKIFLVYVIFFFAIGFLFSLFFSLTMGGMVAAVGIGEQMPDPASMLGLGLATFVGQLALSIAISLAFAALLAAIHGQLSPNADDRIGETFA